MQLVKTSEFRGGTPLTETYQKCEEKSR